MKRSATVTDAGKRGKADKPIVAGGWGKNLEENAHSPAWYSNFTCHRWAWGHLNNWIASPSLVNGTLSMLEGRARSTLVQDAPGLYWAAFKAVARQIRDASTMVLGSVEVPLADRARRRDEGFPSYACWNWLL